MGDGTDPMAVGVENVKTGFENFGSLTAPPQKHSAQDVRVRGIDEYRRAVEGQTAGDQPVAKVIQDLVWQACRSSAVDQPFDDLSNVLGLRYVDRTHGQCTQLLRMVLAQGAT